MEPAEDRLEQIFNDLLDANCICEMSDVLTPLTKSELDAAYKDFLIQYSQELALGVLERSDWICGVLLVNANQPSICFCRMALDAIRDETDRRKRSEPLSCGLPN
jgi:hypothetical protein